MNKDIKNKILEAFYDGCTYKEIQLKCGNPSKKFIKKVLEEKVPDVYKIVTDTKKLKNYRFNKTNRINEESLQL